MEMKRIIAILLAVFMAAALCACSDNTVTFYSRTESSEPSDIGAVESSDIGTVESSEDETEEATEDSTIVVSKSETYKLSSGSSNFADSHMMSDGVAWANLLNDNNSGKYTAVINKNGEVLYFANGRFGDSDLGTTKFINSLSAVFPCSSNNQSGEGFIIVNDKGEEVYSCFDENMYFCGQADDGMFFIIKHDSGIDHDKWLICTLDKDLSFKETGIEAEKDLIYGHEIKKLTDGMYYFTRNHGNVVDLEGGKYHHYNEMGIIGYNDTYLCIYSYGYYAPSDYYFVPFDVLKQIGSEKEMGSQLKSNSSIKSSADSALSETTNEKRFSYWHNGSFYREYSEKAKDGEYHNVIDYMDFDGKVIFTFPDFAEGVRYNSVDDFSGEYAAVVLTGVDKKTYTTIINEQGKTEYEPVQINNDSRCSCNGYQFFYKNKEGLYDIIAPDGSHKALGDDLSGIGDITLTNWEYSFVVVIGGGYIFCNDVDYKYVSLDGNKSFSEVKANYNSDGNLIFTDKDGNKAVSGANAGNSEAETTDSSDVDPSAQKSYVNTDSFDIKGKWKNIGEYTYGQAQTGSIINFDGTNCNFYSPKDTYAFYKKGDNYRLDCTSPLGDTASFTVKIIDDDHIDVSNGSNIVELKRVS